MRSRVKHFAQPNVRTCVSGVVKMILNHKGKRVSFKKIVPGVNTTKDGTNLLSAAVFCSKKGTKPQLYWSTFDRIAEMYGHLTLEEAAEVVKRRKKEGWPWSKLAQLIEAGGTWYPARRNCRLIRSILKKGIPIVLGINANRRPFGAINTEKDILHVIVAIGFTRTHLLYLDPGTNSTVKKILWKTFYRLSKGHDGEALFLL